ncbi:MAG: pyruvate kinase [archaeon]|nr:MAG: pyruvate kinase [archaeon]
MRATKIVCTIGPASRDPKVLRRLVQLTDVFRINFSHGDEEGHREEIDRIRRAARLSRRTVAILQDLPGPKIRVGRIAGGSVDLQRGSRLSLVGSDEEGTSRRIPVNYPDILRSVVKGNLLHLADGLIRLRVEEVLAGEVRCTVVAGGVLSSGKGLNAPGVNLRLQYPTQADVAHLKFGLRQGVDFVAASFVRTPSDIREVRRLLPSGGPRLIVKVEKREAVEDFDAILEEADGAMVARGDLGIEVPIERVPLIQKKIISKCNASGKPVIVATQMLVSMVNFPVPSRAEVTDVSTAILDGTDAVMLSDETTVGKYPVESVRMLDRIARSTESAFPSRPSIASDDGSRETSEAIGRAACRLADYVGAKAIVAPTQTGSTARRVAMYRPRQPIVAMCTDSKVARAMKLYRGVIPVVSKRAKTVDWLFARADTAVLKLGLARRGDRIVVTSGTPGLRGTTNVIKVSVVGSRA